MSANSRKRALKKASKLYDEYVELSKLGQIPIEMEQHSAVQRWDQMAPSRDRPLGLTFDAKPLGLVIRTEN